jgi:hypothetical protein
MSTNVKQANFLLPEEILLELRVTVPKRRQSKVVAEALRKELKRLKLEKALRTSFGAWPSKNHPELKRGATGYIRKTRSSSRIERVK